MSASGCSARAIPVGATTAAANATTPRAASVPLTPRRRAALLRLDATIDAPAGVTGAVARPTGSISVPGVTIGIILIRGG
ncbi:hypothetical protein GCM10009803_03420 [Microbacterium ginsengiterrae]